MISVELCSLRRANQRSVHSGFTLVELLTVISIIGILLGLLLPSIQSTRESARRMQCLSNLRQVALAIHQYEEVHRCFPLATIPEKIPLALTVGIRFHTQILPYVGEPNTYAQIGESWQAPILLNYWQQFGGPHPAGTQRIDVFRCPSSLLPATATPIDPRHADKMPAVVEGYANTDYLPVGGNNGLSGMFPMVVSPKFWIRRSSDVTDGLSNTLAVGEHSYAGKKGDNPPIWLATYGFREQSNFIETSVPINCVESFGGYYWRTAVSDNCSLSFHPGVSQFAFADGSARQLSELLDRNVYDRLGAIADGHALPEF
ncbi:MAG: DUF1559 domain-containing protein [Planctomyces sp.]|nr:DUF1559 domain-containing protein [Planctomyces sp.]